MTQTLNINKEFIKFGDILLFMVCYMHGIYFARQKTFLLKNNKLVIFHLVLFIGCSVEHGAF